MAKVLIYSKSLESWVFGFHVRQGATEWTNRRPAAHIFELDVALNIITSVRKEVPDSTIYESGSFSR